MSWLFKSCWHFVCICLGDLCPSGTYCPLGSSAGTNCPPGTYLNTTGAVSEADCQTCIQGSYCSGYGNVYPTAQCDTGYYCPTGMNVSNPSEYTCPQGQCSSRKVSNDSLGLFKVYVKTKVFPLSFFLLFWNIYTVTAISCCTDVQRMNFKSSEIPIFWAPSIQIKKNFGIIWNYLLVFFSGHYCPQGSHVPIRCDSGKYQDQTGQGSCVTCPAGFFCDNTMSPVILFNSSLWPSVR